MRMRLVLLEADEDGIENVVIRTDANEGSTRVYDIDTAPSGFETGDMTASPWSQTIKSASGPRREFSSHILYAG